VLLEGVQVESDLRAGEFPRVDQLQELVSASKPTFSQLRARSLLLKIRTSRRQAEDDERGRQHGREEEVVEHRMDRARDQKSGKVGEPRRPTLLIG
jgi:hypothetical protein